MKRCKIKLIRVCWVDNGKGLLLWNRKINRDAGKYNALHPTQRSEDFFFVCIQSVGALFTFIVSGIENITVDIFSCVRYTQLILFAVNIRTEIEQKGRRKSPFFYCYLESNQSL